MNQEDKAWALFMQHCRSINDPDQHWLARQEALLCVLFERGVLKRPASINISRARKKILEEIK